MVAVRYAAALPVATLLVAALVAPGCRRASPSLPAPASAAPLIRWHCAGLDALAADTNAAHLASLRALPASAALREQLLTRLERGLARLAAGDTNPAPAGVAEWLRPIFNDLLRAEWACEWTALKAAPPTFVLAARLDELRADRWRQALEQWRAKAVPHEKAALSSMRLGEWMVLATDAPSLQRFVEQPRPTLPRGAWAVLSADLAGLSRNGWLPFDTAAARFEAQLAVTNTTLRAHGRVLYDTPQTRALTPWRVPVTLVRDPLISFTAVRGLGEWAARQPAMQACGWSPAPDQCFLWAMAQIPFQTFAAVPVSNPGDLLERLAEQVPLLITNHLLPRRVGEIHWATNHSELLWRGLPILVPFLKPVKEAAGEFLLGGLFPPRPAADPAPAELLAQLQRDDLLYYDWEITGERAMQWRQLLQLRQIISDPWRRPAGTNGAAWIEAAAPHLGNTVTEITLVSPRELAFTRKSHLGVTGFELAALARWIDAAEFPFLPARQPAPGGAPPPKPPPDRP
jgi:hypothetical protein